MEQPLDEKVVRHVADLARLHINEEEVVQFAQQLSRVLIHMEQLNELDTADVTATAHPLPIRNVFREDAIRQPWDSNLALANAPQRQDDFFRVPKVLDQESA